MSGRGIPARITALMPLCPTLYPVFLNLRGRSVLVVGAGPVGLRKARGLHAAGARVTVVAPKIPKDFPAGIRRLKRRYRTSDVFRKLLVVAATDDSALNTRIAREARYAGALVNRADDAGACGRGADVRYRS